jgi:hypothetical protein
MIEKAGLRVENLTVGRYTDDFKMELEEWVERIRTPKTEVEEIRTRMLNASPALADAILLEVNEGVIHFVWEQVTLIAVKP